MARFRKIRKSRRGSYRGFARKAARRSGVGNNAALFQLDAIIYGAARQKVSNLIQPVTGMIPLGTVADEVGMGLVCYFTAKNTSGMIRNVALKGLVIENARLGEALVQGNLLGSLGSSSTQTNNVALYGYPN